MALTPGRAVAVALVVCAGAAVLLLPPRPRRLERSGQYLRVARDQAARELWITRRAVAVRVLRDSARVLASGRAPGTAATLFVGSWTPDEVTWLEQRIADILDGPGEGGAPAVVFTRDTVFGGFPGLHFAFPDSAAATCVAVYAEGARATSPWYRPRHRRIAPGLLGPCAYYARFGPAGPALEEWLQAGGAALALTSPTFAAPAWHAPPRPTGLARLLHVERRWAGVEPRLAFPLTLDACLTGRLERCGEFARGRRAGNRLLSRLGIHEEYAGSLEPDASFLNDVLVAFGPERFARFWRGAGGMPEAFASAFGMPLNEWTYRWATERFGPGHEAPAVNLGSLGISLGAVAGFLAVALLVAGRRRVGT